MMLKTRVANPIRGFSSMSISIPSVPRPKIIYPDSDGKPMADNTLQFQWIVTIKEGLERVFHDRPDVFVAGDLLWYPVEGHPKVCQAPDTLIAFGRPKGYRGSYKQWEEGGIAPQVVFEVLSPNNRFQEMSRKLKFYEEYGVEEYYLHDPDHNWLEGWRRTEEGLEEIPWMEGWISPRLGIRFDLSGSELTIYSPDGQRFLTYQELAEERDRLAQERDQVVQERDQVVQERDQVVQERDQVVQERDQVVQERDQVVQERDQLARERDAERLRAEQMAARLRAMGLEPPS
jgi:Uma2 family endonuclease